MFTETEATDSGRSAGGLLDGASPKQSSRAVRRAERSVDGRSAACNKLFLRVPAKSRTLLHSSVSPVYEYRRRMRVCRLVLSV